MNIPEKDKKLPISEHFYELKRRLWYCCIVFTITFGFSYYFSDHIIYFAAKPLLKLTNSKFIYTSITEPFFTYLSLALTTSICLAMPFFMIQVYLFVAPGLYHYEKKWVAGICFAFITMFALGALVLYYVILPVAINFFAKFNTSSNFVLDLQPKISEYASIIIQMMFGFGFAFEIPVLLVILVKTGIISYNHLQKFRRFAIVIIFVVAAIVTPPDILSQVILGSIMMLFYELTILICKHTKANEKL